MPFNYDMNARGKLSLREYLYRCIRDDIMGGTVAAGERLPSKRELARRLGVSLITVESAYAQLVAEGYVVARQRSGYFAVLLPHLLDNVPARLTESGGVSSPAFAYADVTAQVAVDSVSAPQVEGMVANSASGCEGQSLTPVPATTSVASTSASPSQQTPTPIADFSRATTPDDSPAAALWSRALRNALVQEPRNALFGAQPSAGTTRLRTAIATYLAQTRGMAIDPDRVVVGAGAQVLYVLVAQLFGNECTVAVEDPGYPQLADVYARCGLQVRHLPLDAEGVNMAALRESDAQVVHIMPSHQFPTGRVTSIARRYELLSWAAQAPGRYIIEDDYDRAFRFAGMPIPSLQSIDAPSRVIYVSTFSKSLSSALRMAYMVLPESLAVPFRERLGFYANTVSVVDQVTLARLVESGEYGRHLNRYRKRQRDVRDALLHALRESELAPIARIEEADSGLHFVLALDTPRLEDGAVSRGEGKTAQQSEKSTVPQSENCAATRSDKATTRDEGEIPLRAEDEIARRDKAEIVSHSEQEIARRAREAGVVLAPLSSYAHNAENACAPDGRRRFVMQYEGLDTTLIPQVVKALEWAVMGK